MTNLEAAHAIALNEAAAEQDDFAGALISLGARLLALGREGQKQGASRMPASAFVAEMELVRDELAARCPPQGFSHG